MEDTKQAEATTVSFRAKLEAATYPTGVVQYVKVPKLKKSHVDMNALRASASFGPYANSDLALNMVECQVLRHAHVWYGPKEQYVFRLCDDLPGITIDTSGFLAKVTISIVDDIFFS